jgi:cyclase
VIKRISASLIIDSGLLVNSYKFNKHLPVGKLNSTLHRLQELQIDDVVILNTTHTDDPVSDFRDIFRSVGNWHVSTPLAYGGGISNVNQALEIIKFGSERVVLSSKSLVNSEIFSGVCRILGDQAVILHLPLEINSGEVYLWGAYQIKLKAVLELLPKDWGGEVMFSFVTSDGEKMPNWEDISATLNETKSIRSIVLAGGFASAEDIEHGLAQEKVVAVAVGNYLHRTELSVFRLKQGVDLSLKLRRAK